MTTMTGTVEVSTTVTVNGVTKTFTATGETGGDAAKAARALLVAVRDDAADWIFDLRKAATR